MAWGGQPESLLHGLAAPPAAELKTAWSRSQGFTLETSLLLLDGLLVAVSREGRLQVSLAERDEVLLEEQLAGVEQVVACPAALEGMLLVATNTRLVAVDLIEKLQLSPGAGSRRGILPLKGEICSHVASDGKRHAAVCSLHEGRLLVTTFQAHSTSLEHGWTRSPAPEGLAVERAHLAFFPGALLVGTASGKLFAYHLETGQLVGEMQLQGLAPSGLVARHDFVLAVEGDGTLSQLHLDSYLSRTVLAESLDAATYGLGAGLTKAVTSHGKRLRAVDLRSGRSNQIELPQHCTLAPLVMDGIALAISADGTLYHLQTDNHGLRVAGSRKLFPAAGAVLCPPVASEFGVHLCGPEGDLVTIDWRSSS